MLHSKTLSVAAAEGPPDDGAAPREQSPAIDESGLASARVSGRGLAIGIVLLLIAALVIAGYVAHMRSREYGTASATALDEASGLSRCGRLS